MLKPLSKGGIEGNFLNMIKVIYEESIYGYVILGIRNFSSKIQNKTVCFGSPLLFKMVLEILSRTVRQEKERHINWKGRSKLSLFTNGTVLCVKNSKDSTKKTPELIANLAKLQDTISTQN